MARLGIKRVVTSKALDAVIARAVARELEDDPARVMLLWARAAAGEDGAASDVAQWVRKKLLAETADLQGIRGGVDQRNRDIRAAAAAGLNTSRIAQRYGMTVRQVQRIIYN